MDVAAASMAMSAASLQMDASLMTAKKVMDTQEAQAQQLLEMLPSAPGLGELLDVRA